MFLPSITTGAQGRSNGAPFTYAVPLPIASLHRVFAAMQRDFTVLIGFNCCTGEGQKILHANHGTAVFRNYGDIFLFALIIKANP